MEFKATIASNGKILLPFKCRQALHLSPGEIVIIRVQGEEATICGVKTALQRVRKIVAKATKGKKTLVEELIQARRAEAQHE